LLARRVLVALLAVHVAAGVYASVVDWFCPFTPAKAAAAYIRSKGLDKGLILVHSDDHAGSVVGYLDRPVFYLKGARFGTYAMWDLAVVEAKTFNAKVAELMAERKQDVLAIMTDTEFVRPEWVKIAHFPRGIAPDEDYTLYLWKHEPPEGKGP
jgi:hypothetical protein